MLTGLKMSSWSCNCVYYRAEDNAKGELSLDWSLKVLKGRNENILTDRARRIAEKNVIICLVFMFTPRIMVIAMSKMAHFLYFLLMLPKK